jgi:hypothetical protein
LKIEIGMQFCLLLYLLLSINYFPLESDER